MTESTNRKKLVELAEACVNKTLKDFEPFCLRVHGCRHPQDIWRAAKGAGVIKR